MKGFSNKLFFIMFFQLNWMLGKNSRLLKPFTFNEISMHKLCSSSFWISLISLKVMNIDGNFRLFLSKALVIFFLFSVVVNYISLTLFWPLFFQFIFFDLFFWFVVKFRIRNHKKFHGFCFQNKGFTNISDSTQ